MKLLSIDPSSTCTGWAAYTDGTCTASGYISRRKGVDWAVRLAGELAAISSDPALNLVVIEDVSNRSNRGKYFGPKLLQWGKAVGIAFGACWPTPCEGYPSNWLAGKIYAKSKHLRLQFANRLAQHGHPVTNVDEATAILFGRWYIDTMQARTGAMIGSVTRASESQNPSRKINVKTSSPAQVVAAATTPRTARPGRRLRNNQ